MDSARRQALVNFVTSFLATIVAILSIEAITLLTNLTLFWPLVLLVVIVWSTSIGGFYSGIASTVLSLLYSWYFFCNPAHSFCYSPDELVQFIPLIMSMPAVLLIVTLLRNRAEKKFEMSRQKIQAEVDRRIHHYESTITASEQRLRTLLEHSYEAIGILDENGLTLYASPSAENVLGYKPDELEGMNVFSLVHPSALPKARAVQQKVLSQEGSAVSGEFPLRHKDGRWIWVETSLVNLLHNPTIHGIVTNYRDITERKLAEQKVKTSEEKYRTLINLAPDIVYSLDKEFRFVSLNPSFEIVTGYRTQDWIGRTILELVHPDDVKRATRVLGEDSISAGPAFELRLIGKNSRTIPIEGRSRPIMEGNRNSGSIGIVRDITDRQRAEDSLRARTVELTLEKLRAEEERSKAETIIASIGDAVFAVDEEGRIILMNAEAEKLSGYTYNEAAGKYYAQIFRFATEDNPKAVYPDFIKEVIQTGTPKAMAARSLLIRRDETQLPISDVAAPFRDKNGNILGAVIAFHDNSKERELERNKDEFISVASHQLRTPLGSMRWTMEMLLQNSTLPEDLRQSLQQLYDNNKRMIGLVNDLLNVSRIDQGRISDKSTYINPVEIITQTVEQVKELAQQHKVSVEFQSQPSNHQIWFDPDRFHEVVENLISNAIKYSREEGKVAITLEQTGDKIRLCVADSGIGIPDSEQNRVFQKFFRAGNAVQSDAEGSGLGLYVVKSYVEKWGGSIWFESKEGEGTKFHVDLPAKSRETEA